MTQQLAGFPVRLIVAGAAKSDQIRLRVGLAHRFEEAHGGLVVDVNGRRSALLAEPFGALQRRRPRCRPTAAIAAARRAARPKRVRRAPHVPRLPRGSTERRAERAPPHFTRAPLNVGGALGAGHLDPQPSPVVRLPARSRGPARERAEAARSAARRDHHLAAVRTCPRANHGAPSCRDRARPRAVDASDVSGLRAAWINSDRASALQAGSHVASIAKTKACDVEEWCCRTAVARLGACPHPEPANELGPLFARSA